MNLDILHETIKPLLEKGNENIEVFKCSSEFSDTQSFCKKYNFLLEDSCNAILIKSKKPEVFYSIFCVLGNDKLDVNKKVKEVMKSRRVSFASKDEAEEVTKQVYGGISPLGLDKDVDIFIDENVMKRKKIFIGGGNRTTKIFLPPLELLNLTNGSVLDLTQSWST